MFGHIFLALNFRSDQEPLFKEGLLSNKVMILWALLVFVTLLVATSTPVTQTALQVTGLSLQNWVLVIVVAFVSTFWMELKKIWQRST
jgi:magnesium-transporting ATPase (P-type)